MSEITKDDLRALRRALRDEFRRPIPRGTELSVYYEGHWYYIVVGEKAELIE